MKKLMMISLMLGSLASPSVWALANPASTHCIAQGGTLQIVTQKDGGQVGMCKLPNGVVCEEWAFFRGQCGVVKPVPAPPIRRPGGFNQTSIDNPDVQKAAQFAAQQISKGKARLKQVQKAQLQMVAGKNYALTLLLSNGERYQTTVFMPLNGRALRLVSAAKL